MQENQCLMVECDDKKFFTHQNNYSELVEFSNLVDAEMSIVRVKNAPILELSELAGAFCNAYFKQKTPEKIEILEKLK